MQRTSSDPGPSRPGSSLAKVAAGESASQRSKRFASSGNVLHAVAVARKAVAESACTDITKDALKRRLESLEQQGLQCSRVFHEYLFREDKSLPPDQKEERRQLCEFVIDHCKSSRRVELETALLGVFQEIEHIIEVSQMSKNRPASNTPMPSPVLPKEPDDEPTTHDDIADMPPQGMNVVKRKCHKTKVLKSIALGGTFLQPSRMTDGTWVFKHPKESSSTSRLCCCGRCEKCVARAGKLRPLIFGRAPSDPPRKEALRDTPRAVGRHLSLISNLETMQQGWNAESIIDDSFPRLKQGSLSARNTGSTCKAITIHRPASAVGDNNSSATGGKGRSGGGEGQSKWTHCLTNKAGVPEPNPKHMRGRAAMCKTSYAVEIEQQTRFFLQRQQAAMTRGRPPYAGACANRAALLINNARRESSRRSRCDECSRAEEMLESSRAYHDNKMTPKSILISRFEGARDLSAGECYTADGHGLPLEEKQAALSAILHQYHETKQAHAQSCVLRPHPSSGNHFLETPMYGPRKGILHPVSLVKDWARVQQQDSLHQLKKKEASHRSPRLIKHLRSIFSASKEVEVLQAMRRDDLTL